ncbi:MAG: hypothetical protein IJQ53_04695 [Clostridia bacterium]|nr:hypothetical protein [Clostridia bacterium]
MNIIKNIKSECRLFACRLCRTKTGWPHQHWCANAEKTAPGCMDCHYYDESKSECAHPIMRRKEHAER